ncbi:ubiquitin carboxyl-terminal hydrolase-domain-containing protein [Apodospora peruviana]|uniref:PAN2-PAN3 deadenylation complex catalytic subunit PAN2 n=1 Tax=Apodospora peruviana TaxID=516989 RepID=A0AAE0M2E7_9PEZI|nr:ubiquitin carboxyl-terminal hydrolase-domain-containing protein [Apodospora peruviana]
MDADWDEVTCVAFPATNHELPRPATALAFDTGQELLWAGNDQGRVVSFRFDLRDLQRYTAFRIQPRSEGPVRQFLFHDRGVIVLGTRCVHMAMRRGPAIWNIRHGDMKDLHCMSFTSKGASEILLAGAQNTMFVIDVNKGEIVKQVPTEHHYTIMKKGRAHICAATKTGSVDLIDPLSLRPVRSWQAHTSYINDMDAQSDFIVTCGGSLKQQAAQTYMLDPYVNVFDLKNMTSMKPMPFPPLAAHVRLHPRMLTTSIVVSQQGQMHVVDLMNPNTSKVRYANITSYLGLFEIAPSGEALVMADSECKIRLWGSPTKIHFTDLALQPELPGPEAPTPPMDWSHDTPISSIGMPYYREPLFSALPADLISDVGAPPVQFDQAFLGNLKKTEFGFYGRNTRGLLRNQYEDTRANLKANNALQPPKFLSEKARELAKSSRIVSAVETKGLDQGAASGSNTELESLKPEATPMYMNLEIKYSKFGVDDFDFGYYNKTRYAGLENHITNSYANSFIQLIHYTPLLRNLALQHAATACIVDPCLLCELGYVFDMLQKAEVSTCQATNMLKALGNTTQAAQLGLLEDDVKSVASPTIMAQGLSRFLLDRIYQEYCSIPAASTKLEENLFKFQQPGNMSELASKVLATSAVVAIKCTHCKNESSRPGTTYVNDLMYPPPKPPAGGVRGGAGNNRAPKTTFSQVLKMSVEREMISKGWCSRCTRYQNLQMRKTIHSVGAVLALNAAVSSVEIRKLWETPGWLPEEIGIIVDKGQFFCFEGQDLKLHMQRKIHNITVYSLVGLVVNIDAGGGAAVQKPPHLVGIVNVAHAEAKPSEESQWHIFNDFSVRAVSAAEALTFNKTWKTPSVLLYHLKAANHQSSMDWKTNLDTSILFKDLSPPSEGKTYRVLDPRTENPGPETIVALDTEFVSIKQKEIQFNSDGVREIIRPMVHALARVSVVRGQGEDEGAAFIDDYIEIRDTVVDYLTQYSGISPGDLDARTSKHNLVSLKVAYKKLWVLLNLGCKFLGHGLKQDFRVINIQVPRAQVVDTIELFYIKPRKLKLSFLASYLLKENIQLETHDSIEDAKTALKLYRKYLEFTDAGVMEEYLDDIYRYGRLTNFQAPRARDSVVLRTDTPPIPSIAPIDAAGGLLPPPVFSAPNTPSKAGGGGFVEGSGAFTPGSSGSPFRDRI